MVGTPTPHFVSAPTCVSFGAQSRASILSFPGQKVTLSLASVLRWVMVERRGLHYCRVRLSHRRRELSKKEREEHPHPRARPTRVWLPISSTEKWNKAL